ncbi:MAG: ATP-binding cassette domain-containing protein [Blautia wexlerae]
MVDWKEMERVSKELLKLIKVDINVNERMDRLSIAQQQIAAIARALNGNCKFILLDEPTSALPKKMLKIYLPLSEI